jgi:3-hydroxybenzoate 6-monooxygenase
MAGKRLVKRSNLPVIVAGGGIGGLAAALALVRQGYAVAVLEQAPEIGEIGAGMQLGPNAFHALDALGVGAAARSLAVYTDSLVMHDAVDESLVGRIETGEAFRRRFGNPYAVIHRADVHGCLLAGVKASHLASFHTNTRIERVEQDSTGASTGASEGEGEGDRTVTAIDQNGKRWTGQALIGAEGGKSVLRQQYVNDPPRVTGHVVYRAVVDRANFPLELQWNAASLWAGPKCHLVHYPLRGGEQYNIVVTFHSRQQEQWGVTDGSKAEVESYFDGICPKARQLLELPKTWKRWATADREPIGNWVFGRATLLGDAAHPTTQYMAQGACMAMEDAVTLGEALNACDHDWGSALQLYQNSRITRTARIVLSGREMGRMYHASGVERLVRNALWQGRTQERFYDAIDWLYSWDVSNCLAPAGTVAAHS